MAFANQDAYTISDARVVSLERRPSVDETTTGKRFRISWVASDVRIVANPLCSTNLSYPTPTPPPTLPSLHLSTPSKTARPILPLFINTDPEVLSEDIIDLYTDDGILVDSPLEMDDDDYAGLMNFSCVDGVADSVDRLLDDLVDAYFD